MCGKSDLNKRRERKKKLKINTTRNINRVQGITSRRDLNSLNAKPGAEPRLRSEPNYPEWGYIQKTNNKQNPLRPLSDARSRGGETEPRGRIPNCVFISLFSHFFVLTFTCGGGAGAGIRRCIIYYRRSLCKPEVH